MDHFNDTVTCQHKEKYLAYHERMSRLFKENRFQFELERKKAIEELIDESPTEHRKEALRSLQKRWDTVVNHSGARHNRLVMAEVFFWDFVRDVWLPALSKGL